MTFHRVGLKLTGPHMKKLARGERIRLTHSQIGSGPHAVHVTKTQLGRMKKAKAEKKGMMLQMSKTQLRHNKMHGTGMFSNLLKSGASALLNSGLGQKAVNYGLGKVADFAKSKGVNADLVDALHGKATNIANAALAKASQHLSGSGAVANALGSIPILGGILGPIAGMFGGKISKAKAMTIARGAVTAHRKDGKSIKHHLVKRIHAHLAGTGRKRRATKPRSRKVGAGSKSGKKRRTKRKVGGSFLL